MTVLAGGADSDRFLWRRAGLAGRRVREQVSMQLRALRTVMVWRASSGPAVFVRQASELSLPKKNTTQPRGSETCVVRAGGEIVLGRRDPSSG